MIFSGSSNPALAKRVVSQLRIDLGRADVGRFSDGEVNVEVHENVRGCDAFVLQSTCAPTNDNIMELIINGGRPPPRLRPPGPPPWCRTTDTLAKTGAPAPLGCPSAPRWWRTCSAASE